MKIRTDLCDVLLTKRALIFDHLSEGMTCAELSKKTGITDSHVRRAIHVLAKENLIQIECGNPVPRPLRLSDKMGRVIEEWRKFRDTLRRCENEADKRCESVQ